MKETLVSQGASNGDWRKAVPASALARVVPVAALAVFGTLFVRHIAALDGAAIWAALTGLSVWQWGGALIFTALSFRAIGVYDVLVHRVLRTGQPPRAARAAGVRAIALSQTLGFGAVTSALVRWRCLPDLGMGAILRLSAVVSLSFLAALAAVTALVVPLSGLVPVSPLMILGGLAAVAGLMVLARLAYRLGWLPARLHAGTLGALLLATALDTGFAAAALWVLWPEAVSFHLLFAAYLIALGAGLVSNAPGGVGAFDLSLLALLPISDDATAMAALLAFRVIYYALPAAIALIGLIQPQRPKGASKIDHPEATLAHQTATVIDHPAAPLLALPCWGKGAVLGDLPEGLSLNDLKSRTLPSALYKCSPVQAAVARAAGWAVLRCAQEAVIDLHSWDTSGSNRRQLRRALKGFAASGLQIAPVRDPETLAHVADTWAKAHGGERGHSMGRFCPIYLTHQAVFAAFDGATPVAFVSFHTGQTWTLDLMRHLPDLPNGTMQALIVAGIEAARAARAETLSLAAVPDPEPHLPLAQRTLKKSAGLRRFKSAFGPTWEARYICAPTPLRLGLTMATLAWAIRRPAPLPNASATPTHPDHEDFSFAPRAVPCEAQPSL